jgi:predicted  nucleic acid-binding Zn-ribbon protein
MEKTKLQEKLDKLKVDREGLIRRYASLQQELQETANEALKIEGAIRNLEELLKEEK